MYDLSVIFIIFHTTARQHKKTERTCGLESNVTPNSAYTVTDPKSEMFGLYFQLIGHGVFSKYKTINRNVDTA